MKKNNKVVSAVALGLLHHVWVSFRFCIILRGVGACGTFRAVVPARQSQELPLIEVLWTGERNPAMLPGERCP